MKLRLRVVWDENQSATMRLVIRLRVALIGLLVLAPACGPDPGATTDGLATVALMMPLDEYGLSWHWSSPAQFLVFSPLVARNAEGELEPRLAASWEHSPDYREWTVRLNTAARWHDGEPVTAGDVEFTLALLSREGGGLDTTRYHLTVLDDSTYHVRYERPGIGTPLDDFTVIYPRHLLADLDQDNWEAWEFWTRPVGSGPFRHVRTMTGLGFEFEANPDYFRARPRVDRVILRFGSPQLQQLQSGEVDVLPAVTELMMMRLGEDERFVGYRSHNPVRSKTLQWNHRSPLFEASEVRRALAMALDRRAIRQAIGLPDDLPVFDALYSEGQFRREEVPDAVPYDTVEAKRILDTAGWRDSDGDGIRDREGRPFRFTLLFSTGGAGSWTAQGEEAVALLVQDALRPLGIAAELQPLEGTTKRDRLRGGNFDAIVADIAGLPMRVEAFGEANQLGYDNPRAAALLLRIASAFDPDSVDHHYRALATLFAADHPVLFLYPAVSTTIVNQRLRGLSEPYRSDAVWYLEDLWLEESRERAPSPLN